MKTTVAAPPPPPLPEQPVSVTEPFPPAKFIMGFSPPRLDPERYAGPTQPSPFTPPLPTAIVMVSPGLTAMVATI